MLKMSLELRIIMNGEKETVKQKNKYILEICDKIDSLKQQKSMIQSKVGKEVTVSDHALLRYIQRIYEIDTDEIEAKIRNKINPWFQQVGDGTYKVDNGIKMVVKNGNVLTVIDTKKEKE